MKLSQFLLLITTIFTLLFLASQNSFSQIEIPSQFSKFQNSEPGIEIEYPSNWKILGDRVPGDYVTDIVFVPLSEVKFKEYDSYEDVFKIGKRVLIMYDYSFVIPKVNLNFALDNEIQDLSDGSDGFKKFELIESHTNSELGGKKAFKFMFQLDRKGDTFKYLELGTIINDNQVLIINFKAPVEEFDLYLPTFQHMIDSFKFGQFENNSTSTESAAVTNTNQEAVKKIFENDGESN